MSDISDLKRKRGTIRTRLTLFKKFLAPLLEQKKPTQVSINECVLRLSKTEQCFNLFEEIQSDIELQDDSEEEVNQRQGTENEFYSLIAQAREFIAAFKDDHHQGDEFFSQSSRQRSGCKNIKLPQLKLPPFDGKTDKWLEFRDLYLSLIHDNEDLDNICKFHYLKSYLEGDASVVIKSVSVSAETYPIAWSLLRERYDNKRLLINQHLKCLFGIEPLSRESDKGIRQLIDNLSKNLQALKSLGEDTEKWDTLIIFMASSKLDNATARRWEEFRSDIASPSLQDFYKFLRNRADVLETVYSARVASINEKHSVLKTKSFIASTTSEQPSAPSGNECKSCNKSHKLIECPKFKSLSVDERYLQVSQWKLCKNCLRPGHLTYQCRINGCRICKKRHSTLLHKQIFNQQQDGEEASAVLTKNNPCSYTLPAPLSSSVADQPESAILSNTTVTMTAVDSDQVLLSTALVKVTCNGNKYVLRALLDSGSQSSFITESARQRIGCNTIKVNRSVSGINNTPLKINSSCDLILNSLHTSFTGTVKCYIVPTVTDKLPSMKVQTQLNIPNNLSLADPKFHSPAEVDLLLGSDIFWDLVGSNQVKLGKNKPVLTETKLGWIVAGPTGGRPKDYTKFQNIRCNFSQEIKEQLSKFWELEELPSTKAVTSSEDNYCEKLFNDSTYRNSEGRFVVRIPFRKSPDTLGDSYKMAKKRFLSIERRMSKDAKLKQGYSGFIKEYEKLGHLTEVSEAELGSQFLPHHAVIREQSETTKLRVVFDASAKTTSGESLNDIQYVGPVVQDDLLSILLRFRQHKYIVTADIEKMYRQILVEPSQRKYQQILWRDQESENIRILQLNTITYGTASAPFLSTRCLLQLAKECDSQTISKIIQNDFYMDDLLTGAQTEAELSNICKSVTNILNGACLPIRKFHTNSPTVVKNSLSAMIPKDLDVTGQSRALGLKWQPAPDYLQFSVEIEAKSPATKRSILSNSAKIFDPLGLLSAVTITPKIILQRLWVTKLDWDDPIPAELHKKWTDFEDKLKHLVNIDIPRHVLCSEPASITLHSFSDASQDAYAACIYLASTDSEGNTLTRLLCAKAKVAPLKPTSIPRLELLGALLSVRLTVKVQKSLTCKIDHTFHWTDSVVVLSWLGAEPRSLKTFVANRIGEIQELSPVGAWKHVPGHMNPADLASRGIDPQHLCTAEIWWQGPLFLMEDISSWPQLNQSMITTSCIPESKTFTQVNNTTHTNTVSGIVDFEKYSKLTTLQRAFAYVRRFIFNLHNPTSKRCGYLTTEELKSSLNYLIKQSQLESFGEDLNILQKGKALPSKSRILKLTPFIHEDGLLRVGGRIQNSSVSYTQKHPILLDAKHMFTKLLFQREHFKTLHGPPQLILNNLRNQFWPVSGRILARSTVNKCKTCWIMKAKSVNPIMGNLPESRVTPSLPFMVCGVDFAGPFLISDRKGRGCKITKAYLALFVCFSTRALHLELVSGLSADAFIQCLRRFISRRGYPSEIHCDNGTNFVGASNELATFLKLSNDPIASFAANEGIKFVFSPAYSPHFGGIWEAGVKSAKFHLTRVLGNTHMTFEELSTLLTQIEAILNSRPITPLSTDPNDLEALTPGHFLIGRPLISVPSPNVLDVNRNRLSRYQYIEQMRQQFWARWRKEFLAELQQRSKWQVDKEGLNINDIVVIKETNVPPMKWRLGRILKLYPGADNVTRVADISTGRGTIRRAVRRLCVLPKTEAAFLILEDLPPRGGPGC